MDSVDVVTEALDAYRVLQETRVGVELAQQKLLKAQIAKNDADARFCSLLRSLSDSEVQEVNDRLASLGAAGSVVSGAGESDQAGGPDAWH
jgi:hypothetical protein